MCLFCVVECQAANVSIWVCLFALLDFIQNLRGVIATKHGQFPQSPVSPIIVIWYPAVFPVYVSHLPKKFKEKKKTLDYSRFKNKSIEQWKYQNVNDVFLGLFHLNKLFSVGVNVIFFVLKYCTSSNSRQGIHPFLIM